MLKNRLFTTLFCIFSLIFLIINIFEVRADEYSNDYETQQPKIESKYKFITFDLFGGVMYGGGVGDWGEQNMKNSVTGLYGFAGIDFYLGGYFDKFRKVNRERLISPLIGMQIDYNFLPTEKTDCFSYADKFSLLFRLGVLFKLKYDINLKLYAIVGFNYGTFKMDNSSYGIPKYDFHSNANVGDIMYYNDTDSGYFNEKHNVFAPSLGLGLEGVIKERILIGIDFRANTMEYTATGLALYEKYSETRSGASGNVFGKTKIGMVKYSVLGKVGLVF